MNINLLCIFFIFQYIQQCDSLMSTCPENTSDMFGSHFSLKQNLPFLIYRF